GLESMSIRLIQGVGYSVLEFLKVGTTFDIFQNILFSYSLNTAYCLSWIRRIGLVSFVVFGEYWHRYAVSSLMDTAYWVSEQRYLMPSPTINENVIVNELASKHCYKIKFSRMIGYKHVIADFLPTLSINMMTKRFYNSIFKDEGDLEGNDLARTLIDIPIFVGNFSIISGFSIIDDMDVTSGVVLGMPFCKKFVSCQKIMEKFACRDECKRLKEE
ncbi:hypothetical protein Tco_1543703, partial [Tanacetum coccineum]